jgi:acetyl-CoA carboxylase carboxyl transferase subunit beta
MKEFFRRSRKNFTPGERTDDAVLPDNLWTKCPSCRELIYQKELQDNFKVCPKCGFHMRIGSREWLALLDEGSFEEFDGGLTPRDPLGFVSPKESYAQKLKDMQARTELNDAVISGRASIDGRPLMVAICDFGFIGGSMGSVYGEKMARAAERAAEAGVPLLTINSSGGARMQEGVVSLMQMAKITMALTRLASAGQPHISLLVDPCYGGVLASYASIADIILAEPGANIGFAGPRVVDQTVGGKSPTKAKNAEFMLERGMIDGVTPRGELRATLGQLLRHFANSGAPLIPFVPPTTDEAAAEAPAPPPAEDAEPAEPLSAWDRVQLARHRDRPHTLEYIRRLCDGFVELHGDRRFGDDAAIVGGLAAFCGRTVLILGHQKGRNTRENLQRHFGMARPEGYRKVLRLLALAEKFGLPVLCFIDTPGADPERESEERGQANAIAECILAMARLQTPVVASVIGEGNSGGAIAIGVSDRLLMLENAIYMVVSPEGCASILWRDSSKAPEAARAMRITAQDVLELGIADEVIPEPGGGAHASPDATLATLGEAIARHLGELLATNVSDLLEQRYAHYRSIGSFDDPDSDQPISIAQLGGANGTVPH